MGCGWIVLNCGVSAPNPNAAVLFVSHLSCGFLTITVDVGAR
jgi:hypothetical protein